MYAKILLKQKHNDRTIISILQKDFFSSKIVTLCSLSVQMC